MKDGTFTIIDIDSRQAWRALTSLENLVDAIECAKCSKELPEPLSTKDRAQELEHARYWLRELKEDLDTNPQKPTEATAAELEAWGACPDCEAAANEPCLPTCIQQETWPTAKAKKFILKVGSSYFVEFVGKILIGWTSNAKNATKLTESEATEIQKAIDKRPKMVKPKYPKDLPCRILEA